MSDTSFAFPEDLLRPTAGPGGRAAVIGTGTAGPVRAR